VIYGGPDLAWEVGGRVREMHKRIKGCGPTASATTRSSRALRLGPRHPRRGDRPRSQPLLPPGAPARRGPGVLGGVAADGPPDRRPLQRPAETWPELLAYFDEMVETELTDTEAAQDVLVSLISPTAPPLPALHRDWIWRVVSWPSTKPDR